MRDINKIKNPIAISPARNPDIMALRITGIFIVNNLAQTSFIVSSSSNLEDTISLTVE